MQRLMTGARMQRVYPRGHRLHALARQRQHQAGAVVLESRMSVCVPQSFAQVLQIAIKALARVHRSPFAS
ncbi:hypothetical protein WJ69_19810 [Burkholderia ubonensis]|nr:hypothetical protein WJ69_19810 [Burkholderia ubonensis]